MSTSTTDHPTQTITVNGVSVHSRDELKDEVLLAVGTAVGRTFRADLPAALSIPGDTAFDGDDFLADARLDGLGQRLREDRGMPLEPTVVYRWKRKGGKRQGVDRAGYCQKLSGPAKHFAGADYLVWLAADNLRDARYGSRQLEALLCHELLHIAVEYTEDGEPVYAVRHHDAELFAEDLAWYGLYSPDLEKAAEAFEQLRLGAS